METAEIIRELDKAIEVLKKGLVGAGIQYLRDLKADLRDPDPFRHPMSTWERRARS